MKKIVILGSGPGGTMVANKLRNELNEREWQIQNMNGLNLKIIR